MSASGRIAALCLGLMFLPGGAAMPQSVPAAPQAELTLPQARALALEALRQGDAVLAANLADGLLQADPKSAFAHFVLARARSQQGKLGPARRAAARAYRTANTKELRYSAAQMAARLSYREERPTLTQLWLRRAVQSAPNDTVERKLGQDYARLRAENPFAYSFRFSLRPSNNVNNGADSAVQIIDGLPFTGMLSGSAQALSGTIGAVDTQLSYRLKGDERSLTRLGARLYVQRVALSSDAKDKAPGVSNSDFGSTFAEVSLDHAFAVGADGRANLKFALGTYWAGKDRSYDFARIAAGRHWKLSTQSAFSLSGTVERRDSAISGTMDSTALSLTGAMTRNLQSKDRIRLSLNLRKTESDFDNSQVSNATLGFRYAFAKRIGTAKFSTGLVLGYSDYPDYTAVFRVPGGRQDKSFYADADFFFDRYDYAGFAPTVRVRAGLTSSNVSRFDTNEFSVTLGFRSKF